MKKFITQSIGLLTLVVIAFAASSVTAGNPAIQNPGGFPDNNTPFPVTVGAYMQTKGAGAPPANGGGLAVEAFIAWQNASFDKDVGIQGILTGKPVSNGSLNSNLLFGKFSPTASLNNKVDVSTTGWTYAQNGGLYTPVEKAAAGNQQPLCANNAGQIIICPGVPAIIPEPTITGTITGTGSTVTITLDQPALQSLNIVEVDSRFNVSGIPTYTSMVIRIAAGSVSGSESRAGSQYLCTFPAESPNIFTHVFGGVQYVLTVVTPCS